MDYLLDTNIVLAYTRQDKTMKQIDAKYDPIGGNNASIISAVTVGEINSIAIRNKWGKRKLNYLDALLNKFMIADINIKKILHKYAEIDSFSQGKLPGKKSNFTSRNMGKNDIWIAATASVLNIELITTDKDFLHLDKEFVKIRLVELK